MLVLLLAAALASDVDPDDPFAAIQGPHGADPVPRERRAPTWDTWGEARARADGGTDPALDPDGTTAGRTWWLSSRVIAGVDWRAEGKPEVELEIEALNGLFAGQTTAVGTAYDPDVFAIRRDGYRDLNRFLPRKLAARWTFPKAGRLSIGAQLFTWGTGMLANDGAGDPDFGDPNRGNVVGRAAFATAPWRPRETASLALRGLSFFVAADVVLRDENASLFDGDLALQGIVGLRLDHPRASWGAFAVGRWQRDRLDPRSATGERTTAVAFPVDTYLKVLLTDPASTTQRVLLEVEGVYIEGTTDRPYLEETVPDGARVRSLGAIGRLRYDHDDLGFTAKLEAGFASGDADPRDDVVRTFTFHADHQVGLILFDQVLPLVGARGLDRVADPALVAVPPPGGRFSVNQGAVSNAVYVFPVLRFAPVRGLDVRLGYLTAWSAAPYSDPYASALNGGYNTTPGGVLGGARHFGHEVDLGLRYTVALPAALRLELGFEGATLVPGAAFDGLAGSRLATQWLGRGRVTFSW